MLETVKPKLLTLLQFIALSQHVLVFTLSLMAVVTFAILLFTNLYFIPIIYMIWFLYDEIWLQASVKAGHLIPAIRQMLIWKLMASYFPICLYKTVDLDPNENYIFTGHPHGHFGHGYAVSFASEACGFSTLFPGIKLHILTLDSFFKWPLLREWLLICGMGSVKAKSIESKLRLGRGHSVFLIPGGAPEMFQAHHKDYFIEILHRKGFIRLALKTGASIVPVFHFGENEQFKLGELRKGSFQYWFKMFLEKTWGVKLPYVYGRFSALIPIGKPINHVVGSPIKFNKTELEIQYDGEMEIIDACHSIYLTELRKLFESNKARFGENDRNLIFI